MERPIHLSSSVRFGPFELDVRSAELRYNGRKTLLHEQPFQVLIALLERPGELISREELVHRLWPDGTFVDYERGLNKAVNKLRDVLHDSADSPRFVETIPRRGYRFIAPLEGGSALTMASGSPVIVKTSGAVAELAAEHRTSSLTTAKASAEFAWKQYALWVACAVLLAVAFAGYRFWPHPNAPGGLAKITQISQWNKAMNEARLSPDGHAVAFDSPVDGIEQVFLMLTSGGEPLQLTNDEGKKYVYAFSPDGKEIYYSRNVGHDDAWAVPTLGGAPRRVVSGIFVVPSLDGAFIYYSKTDGPGVFRSEKSGLNEELVYKSQGTDLYFVPILLFPGGNDLLAGGFRAFPAVRLFRINLTSHEAADLGEITANLANSGIVWADPGNSVLFSRTVNGLTNIWKYNLLDRSLTQVTFGTGPDFSPMSTPTGSGIYYVNGKSSGFLSAYHVPIKESTDITLDDATAPAISPDGRRVMYITFPAPQRSELWVSDIYGSNKVKIASGEDLGTLGWAKDNFHLSFTEQRAIRGTTAYIVSADGSSLRQVPPTGGVPWTAVWSPDQESVYLSVSEKTGPTVSIWRWNVDGSSPQKSVDNCAVISDVDPSGKYLVGAVQYGGKTGIYEVSTSERKCIPLLPGVSTFNVTFARDGKSFLYAVASRGKVTIYSQPWRDGKLVGAATVALKVRFVFPLTYHDSNAYDFSKDLSTLVYVRPGGHADIYLLSQK